MILNQYCVPSQDTMLFIIFRTFHFMILNQWLFHLRILCYLYLKALSIHDFKSVLCSISGYYVIYILQDFSFHNFKSVVVPPQDTALFIFKGVANSRFKISIVCSIQGYYSISIFYRRFQFMILNQFCLFHLRIPCYLYLKALSIHDLKSLLFVPSQETIVFLFLRRFQTMILNQYCLFHLRILCYLYLKAFSIHDFKSVMFVSSQDTMLFIFKGVFNS